MAEDLTAVVRSKFGPAAADYAASDVHAKGESLARIVELMWKLRYTDARRHVREETPFFTGPRVGVEELVAKLP